MNLEQLKYVLEVTREGSILGAANRLFVTQSAVSQSITSLETELGVTIFNRSRTGCTLTDSGERVITIFNEILDKIKELQDFENKPFESLYGHLVIAMSNFAFMSFLPNVIQTFRNTFPNVGLEINDLHMSSVISSVLLGSSDFGLILVNDTLLQLYKKDFSCHILCSSELRACVSKSSPLASKKSITPADLLDYPLVLSSKTIIESLKVTIPEISNANVLFYTNNANLIIGSVENNSAITFLTDISIRLNPSLSINGVVPIPFDAPNAMHFVLIYLKNKYLTIPEKEFIRLIHIFIPNNSDLLTTP